MSCPIRIEGQEYVCGACGVRWDFHDEQPECREGGPAEVSVATMTARMSSEGPNPSNLPRRRASDAQNWTPPTRRLELAARLRKALAMQTDHGQDPVVIGITPNLARDLVAELERTP